MPEVHFLPDECEPVKKKKKTWCKRPDHWKTIVEYYIHSGFKVESTRNMYRDFFGNYNDAASYKILSQWKLDYKNQKEMRVVGSGASYGKEIDEKLHGMVSKRMRLGLPIDNFILRTLLVKLLILHDKEGMLKEYGGIHTYDSAWADRFYKRWKIKRRIATTKMREVPADLEQKKNTFINVGAALI